jgi:tyrosyl-tRNA synthetase
MSLESQVAELTRGAIDVIDRAELRAKLERGRPLIVKLGADPTAPDLHLGHTVVLGALRRFQDHGHRVQFLIGDFTASIGDPSGRNALRPPLSAEAIRANAETYASQVAKVLRPDAMEVVFNSTWFERMPIAQFIELLSCWTLAQMLEREDFANRYAAHTPIALHELTYPLVQGHDSVAMHADVELGGTDQRFNLLVGRQLQRDRGHEPQVVITMPLLVGTDGVEKLSKSKGNAIGIVESPTAQVTKTMAITDDTMRAWYPLLSERVPEADPRVAKLALAREIVERFHGAAAAAAAIDEYERKAHGGAPDTMPEHRIAASTLADALILAGLATSRNDAWQSVKNKAISVDGVRATDAATMLGPGTYVLRMGKNRFARVIVS